MSRNRFDVRQDFTTAQNCPTRNGVSSHTTLLGHSRWAKSHHWPRKLQRKIKLPVGTGRRDMGSLPAARFLDPTQASDNELPWGH